MLGKRTLVLGKDYTPLYKGGNEAGIVFRFVGFYLDVFVGAVLFLSFGVNAWFFWFKQ